jgi:hypothetical protein
MAATMPLVKGPTRRSGLRGWDGQPVEEWPPGARIEKPLVVRAPTGDIALVYLAGGPHTPLWASGRRTVGNLELIYLVGNPVEGFPDPGGELAHRLERLLRADAATGLKRLAWRVCEPLFGLRAKLAHTFLDRTHARSLPEQRARELGEDRQVNV